MNKFLKLTLLSTVMLPSVMATDTFQPYYTPESHNVKQNQSKSDGKKEYSFLQKTKKNFDIILGEKTV